MSRTRSSSTSRSSITTTPPPRARNTASTISKPKRASRSRCSTTSQPRDGFARTFKSFRRVPFRAEPTSSMTPSSSHPSRCACSNRRSFWRARSPSDPKTKHERRRHAADEAKRRRSPRTRTCPCGPASTTTATCHAASAATLREAEAPGNEPSPPSAYALHAFVCNYRTPTGQQLQPNDPARDQPGHRACIDAANLRAGLEVEADPREVIRDYLMQRVALRVVGGHVVLA